MIRVGFTGTQRGCTQRQRDELNDWFGSFTLIDEFELHHGDCIGADAEAHEIARGWGARVAGHPPTDPKKRAFCRFDEEREPKPYLDRNHDIVDETEWMVAAPGEMEEQLRSGTWATIRYARKRGRRLIIVHPDGSSAEEDGRSEPVPLQLDLA